VVAGKKIKKKRLKLSEQLQAPLPGNRGDHVSGAVARYPLPRATGAAPG
jgi:hypothetical protein